jgi:hypothetical protein
MLLYASMAFRKHLLYLSLVFFNYYLETLGATKFSRAIIKIVSIGGSRPPPYLNPGSATDREQVNLLYIILSEDK